MRILHWPQVIIESETNRKLSFNVRTSQFYQFKLWESGFSLSFGVRRLGCKSRRLGNRVPFSLSSISWKSWRLNTWSRFLAGRRPQAVKVSPGELRHRCAGAYKWCSVTERLQIRGLSIVVVMLTKVYVVGSPKLWRHTIFLSHQNKTKWVMKWNIKIIKNGGREGGGGSR